LRRLLRGDVNKMKTQKVVSYKQLPSKLPFGFTAIVYLLVDKFQPSDLIRGIIIGFIVLLWLAALYQKFVVEESTEIKELK
jgi:hypothetical protein